MPFVCDEFIENLSKKNIQTIQQLLSCKNERVIRDAGRNFDSLLVNSFLRVYNDILSYKISSMQLKLKETIEWMECSEKNMILKTNSLYDISVNISRLKGSIHSNIYTSKYHKPKTSSWWIILAIKGSGDARELLGIDIYDMI